MAFQKINDNLYLNQALVVSCGVIQKGSKNIYTLKLNSGVDVNLTDICPNNEMAEAIYNQVKAWEGGGGGGPVGPLEDLMYDDEHTLGEVMDTKLEGPAKDLLYDDEGEETLGDVIDGKVDETRKIGGISLEEDTDELAGYKYKDREETVIIPVELVDGQAYNILMSDLDVDCSSHTSGEEIAVSKSGVYLEFYDRQEEEGLFVNYWDDDNDLDLYFIPSANRWETYEGDPYEGDPLTFTVDTSKITDFDVLCKCFGLAPREEHIQIQQTLEEHFDDFANWKFQEISNKINPITAGKYKPLPQYTQELEEEIMYEMGGYVAGLISGITNIWGWTDPQSGDSINFLRFDINDDSYIYNYVLGQWFINSADQDPIDYENIPAFVIQNPTQIIGSDVIFRQICVYGDGTPIPPYKEKKVAETKVGDFPNWLIQSKGQQMLGSIDWDRVAQIIEQNGWSEYTQIYDDYNINPDSYMHISFSIAPTPEGKTGTNYYITVYTNDQNYKQSDYCNYRYGLNLDDPSSVQHIPANTWWQSGYGPMGYFQLIRHTISDEAQTILNKEICNLVFSGNEVSYKSLQETLDSVPQGLAKNFIYDKISGEGGVQPVFNLMTVIQENQAVFAEAFGSISDATIYGSEGDMQHWVCVFQMVDDEPVFMWGKQIDTDAYVYKFTLSTGKWTTFTVNSSTGPSLEEEVTSQEELPIIDDYDESLIQEGFEEVVPLMITDSQGGDVAINLEQKFNEPLKDKVYEINTVSAFYDVPKWSKINITDMTIVYDNNYDVIVRVMLDGPGNYVIFAEIGAGRYPTSYRIQNFDGYGDIADTWYPEKPVIQYDASAVIPGCEDIWKAIYQVPGAVTLEEKLNSIGGGSEDEELKNKTYGTEVTVLSTPVLVDGIVTTEVQPKVGGVLPEIEGLPSSQSENQLPIYFDDQVLISYYYYRQGSTSGWMENFSGYRVFTVDNQMFDYQELYNSSTRNEWAGISDQNNAPTIAGLWTTLGTRPVPIGYRSEVPNYYDCQYISSYELVTRKPAMWDQAYRLFYYYDSDNDEYYPITDYEAPVWGEQDVYSPAFSYLDSEPEDWENVYDSGEYFDPTIPFAIIQSIFCRVQKQTFTLEQKVNQIGYSSAYITDLPTESNLSGRLIIVLCSEEPEYKYDGYLYIVAEDADLTPYTSGAQDNSGNGEGGGSIIDPGMITPMPAP